MNYLREFLEYINTEFGNFDGISIHNENGFSMIAFSDFGESIDNLSIYYSVTITFMDNYPDVVIRIAKHIKNQNELENYKLVNLLNYRNSICSFYINESEFIVIRNNFKPGGVEDILTTYKQTMDLARIEFKNFESIKE